MEFTFKTCKQQLNIKKTINSINKKETGQRSKWTFVQRRYPDGHKAPENMPGITVRKMPIKTAVRYQLTWLRMAIFLKIYKELNAAEGEGNRASSTLWGGGVHGWCSHEGKPWRFLKTLNTDLTHDKASAPLALELEKIIKWFLNHLKWFVHPNFQGSTVDDIQHRASTRVSINREMKRLWNTLSYPREWKNAIVRSMEGLRFIILSEVSPRGKEIYHWWVQSINSHTWTNL